MTAPSEDRYEALRRLGGRPDGPVVLARDRWAQAQAVRKSAARAPGLQELRVLLAIPPGVGPHVLDAAWDGADRVDLILEPLPGASLREAAAALSPGDRVAVFLRACDLLSDLHRAGFVHGDLKPDNLFVGGESDGARDGSVQDLPVRLLDFGFALSRLGHDAETEPQRRGGTPGFVAPELARNWTVDGRADLYGLAATFEALFPRLRDEPGWSAVLSRGQEPVPARRFSGAAAMKRALCEGLGLDIAAPHAPPFGSGPMRGREDAMARLVELLSAPGNRIVLVQARPHHGLTRFLLEAVAAAAGRGGPALRVLDLPALGAQVRQPHVAHWIDRTLQRREQLVVGLDDPSPRLAWSGRALDPALRALLSRDRCDRLALESLEASVLAEIAADSLDRGGDRIERWAARASVCSDGDLACCAAAFAEALAPAGTDAADGWTLAGTDAADGYTLAGEDTGVPSRASDPRCPPPPGLAHVDGERAPALVLCARAGREAPRRIYEGLLAAFAPRFDPRTLLDAGWLLPAAPDLLRFATRRLWLDARSAACEPETAIAAWLNDAYDPDPRDTEPLLEAVHRARELGDRAGEAGRLARALECLYGQQAWQALRRVAGYPGGPIPTGSVESAREQAVRLARTLGTGWGADRLLLMMGAALRPVDLETGTTLLRLVGEDVASAHSVEALLLLADYARGPDASAEFDRLADLLQAREQAGHPVPAGVLASFRAHLAWRRGDAGEAERRAQEAARDLAGSGRIYESYNLQMLAILRFAREPQRAIDTLAHALERAPDREIRAQITQNLAMMYARSGQFTAAARITDREIARLEGRVRASSLAILRLLRAWAWADLDQVERARREAHRLLNLAVIRSVRGHHVAARLLIGYTHLHRWGSRRALSEASWAWQAVREARYVTLRTGTLRSLIDTLLDLEAWDVVREHGESLRLDPPGDQALDRTCAARADALRAQAEGRPAQAVARLAGELEAARTLSERSAAARYLHQLALAHLALHEHAREEGRTPMPGLGARAGAEAAEPLLREALAFLGTEGWGYHRALAWVALARTQAAYRKPDEALESVDQAVALARRIESQHALAGALRVRAALVMDPR